MISQLLQNLGFQDSYRSDRDRLDRDFYKPALAVSARYDRAVGYFTARGLAVAASGLDQFKRRGGRIRLVAGPVLTKPDSDDMRAGYVYRDLIERQIFQDIEHAVKCSPRDAARLGLVGRLIAERTLDIKIAIMHGRRGPSLYHEKVGIMTDLAGDSVVFCGSLNETESAYLDNFEAIEIYRSWIGADEARVLRHRTQFEDLWSGNTPRLEVLEFPKIAQEQLIALSKSLSSRSHSSTRPGPTPVHAPRQEPRDVTTEWATCPDSIILRDYQKDAVDRWLAAGGRGVFRMATGTGKTTTANAVQDQVGRQMRARNMPLVTVIVVPLLDLVDQWSRELKKFGVVPIKCRESSQTWRSAASSALAGLRARKGGSITLIVTSATFCLQPFQQFLSGIDTPLLFIADEMHGMGAERIRTLLPGNAQFRLGLSATPERWFDPEGTDALFDYFGEPVIELGLADAIKLGALTPYRYTPVLVELDEDEADLYVALTSKIGRLFGRMDREVVDANDDSLLSQLLRKRSQVLGHAQAKVDALASEMGSRRESWYQLVYCAEGGRPAAEGSPGGRQIDKVMALIGNDLAMQAHPFTSREDREERRRILASFETGRDLQVLVAMRCLDEGVDLPDARTAYLLASSTNPRQFIQRRGRILRRAPGKRRAEIVDFVAVPPRNPELFEIERGLFRRELTRCVEFARYAENAGEALSILRPLRDHYQLLDV